MVLLIFLIHLLQTVFFLLLILEVIDWLPTPVPMTSLFPALYSTLRSPVPLQVLNCK